MQRATDGPVDTDADVDQLLVWAGRAPSVHNTQPWLWRVRGTRVDLHADFRRQLVYADPQRRDLLISCGAALHHLQVAAGALGWAARVRRVPDPAEERLIASVQLTRTRPPVDGAETLALLGSRVTDRRRLSSWPVPADRLNSLAMTGSTWGAQVLPVEQETTRARLEGLTRQADLLQRRNPRYIEELDAWVVRSGDQGVPAGHVPRADTGEQAGQAADEAADTVNRRFPHGVLADPVLDGEPPADGMLLICTSSDDTVSRVRAGEALSAMWLKATREKLSMVPLSQALEVDETRRVLQDDVLGDLAYAQLLLRVGWLPLSRAELEPTPRRPLNEVRIRY